MTGASYTAAGALAALTLLNGRRTDYRYADEPGIDQSQRLHQLTVTTDGTTLLDLYYSYDAVSNLTGLVDATPGCAERLTFSYDAFNRLRTVSGETSSASYTYDRLDRLTSVTEGSDSTIFGTWSAGTETNTPGQPRHAPRYIGNPSNQFGYDPAGNMIIRWLKQGGTYTAYTQQFNVDNRLSQVIGNGTTTTYDLDAHTGTTLRRTQTSGGTTTVTDFVRRYYQKNVTAGTGTAYYDFGDRLVAQLSTKRTFLHGDHLGSTVLVTDGAGAVLARYRYHAYGRQREGSSSTERRFTGQRVEASSYLYDYQARYYAPALGLFVSPDPLVPEPGRPATLNRYAYALNNPLRYTDPTGHWTEEQLKEALGENWRELYFGKGAVFENRDKLLEFLLSDKTTNGTILNEVVADFFTAAAAAHAAGVSFENVDAIGARIAGSASIFPGFVGLEMEALLNLTSGELSLFGAPGVGTSIGDSFSLAGGFFIVKGIPSNADYRRVFWSMGINGGNGLGLAGEFFFGPMGPSYDPSKTSHGAFAGAGGPAFGLATYASESYYFELLRYSSNGLTVDLSQYNPAQVGTALGRAFVHDVLMNPIWNRLQGK